MARKSPSHVGLQGSDIICSHCGVREEVFAKPIAIASKRWKAFMLVCQAFEDEHAKCEETEKSPSCAVPKTPEEWLAGLDTGISSRVIYGVLHSPGGYPRWHGGEISTDTPFDPDDFGRCHRLLKLFPKWRARLPEVAKKHPEWAPLVAKWSEMQKLYEAELPTGRCPKLYALMQKIRGLRSAR